jgi:hypothetical protein
LNRENKNQNQFQVDWTVRNWRENKWGPEPPLHDDWWIFLEFQKVILISYSWRWRSSKGDGD